MKTASFSRRTFLRGAGTTLALPLFDCFARSSFGKEDAAPPRRFLGVCATLGFHAPFLFPQTPGRDYETTPYLELLQDYRGDYTVFSGVAHPDVDGGHFAEASFLTAAPHPKASSFRNTISLDQYLVEKLAPKTRFPYLALSTRTNGLSITAGGVQIPPINSPSTLFRQLFLDGDSASVDEQIHKLRLGKSVLDTVLGQTRKLNDSLGSRDREKLDQYMTAIRDVEGRLATAEAWAKRPKPKVAVAEPIDIPNEADMTGRARLLFDLVQLAFETDSTRYVTISMDAFGSGQIPIPGVSHGHHALSHHGLDPEKIAELRLIEEEQFRTFAHLLGKLKGVREQGGTLLDRTAVVFGSNLGNASSHDNRNMPMFLAGGGFRHGSHLAFDREQNYPAPNLFVSVLQRLGVETDRFASSTGTMRGLEMI